MLVQEFKNNYGYMYEQGFLDSLPEACLDDGCNSPMEISEALTGMHCSNPRCPTKIVNRLVAMGNMLGVKNLGSARARNFIMTFGIRNPLLIFSYEPQIDGAMGDGISVDVSQAIVDQFMKRNSFTLWEYVRLANLPYVQTSALQIFGEYDDLAKAYADIESGGVAFIQNKLSIKGKATNSKLQSQQEAEGIELDNVNQDVSIRALKIYTSLMTFKSDLFQSLGSVNIIKINTGDMKVLKAVCSEEVGSPYKTKAEFYAVVNNMFPNLHVEFLSSVNKSIDYLVWAGAEDSGVRVTNKVNKVNTWNEKYYEHKQQNSLKPDEHEIPIVSARQFIEILKGISSN